MMQNRITVRAMQEDDLPTVLAIQSCCYDATKLESYQSFSVKRKAAPTTCFMALVAGRRAGYLVAVPSVAGSPPPLNSPDFALPSHADALYLHDLAVAPAARGTGVAVALIEAYFQAAKLAKVQRACLMAVNGSGAFWQRYGFEPMAHLGSHAESMATYGDGAQYMGMLVSAGEPRR